MKEDSAHAPSRKRTDNNFDLLRLLAAFGVLLSHSYGILDKGLQQPHIAIGGQRINPSDLGLDIFFTISGYLVTQSLFTSRSCRHYLWKRLVRIVPALLVVNAVCVVMGAFVTTLPVTDYFTNYSTWRYLIINSTLFRNQPLLPGVFTSLHNNIVNASTWTLLIEVRFYIALLIAGMLSLLRYKWLMLSLFVLFEAAAVYFSITQSKMLFFDPAIYFIFGSYFFPGVLYRCFEGMLSFSWWHIAFLLLALLLTLNTIMQPVMVAVFISYSVISIGKDKTIIRNQGWDISYGFYLYAFPVQQLLLLALGYAVNVWLHIVLSAVLTSAFAILSWRYIEQPAMNNKNRFIAQPSQTTSSVM